MLLVLVGITALGAAIVPSATVTAAASDDAGSASTLEPPTSYPAIEGPRSGDMLLAASRGRTCMVRVDRTVTCWGDHGLRQRLSVAGLHDVVALTSGDETFGGRQQLHVCALHAAGTVSCWGSGGWGQLGQGDGDDHYTPVRVRGLDDAVAISAGLRFTCAVHRDGGVSCWGSNYFGEIGHGLEETEFRRPTRVPGVTDAVAISSGNDSTCVIHGSGGVTCWGWGAFEGPPRAVDGLRGVTAISIGGEFTCVVVAGGEVSCWSTYFDPITPWKMDGLRDVVDVAMGFGTGCAVHRDGGVSCWGDNNVGQVGDGTREARTEPVRLADITDAIDVSLGRQTTEVTAHSCVLHRDGGVSCWGGNDRGQLGDGTSEHRPYPQRAEVFTSFPTDESPELDRDLLLAWIDNATGGHKAEFPWHWAAWDYTRHRNG